MARSADERVQTARKYKKINASAFFTAAHNGLVTGSSLATTTDRCHGGLCGVETPAIASSDSH
jgi:hypothetical protein